MPTHPEEQVVTNHDGIRRLADVHGRKAATACISGSREQVKATRGSTRGARTASARGQHRNQERRAA